MLRGQKKHKDTSSRGKRSLITKVNPKSPISEQVRTIRTNIEFSMVDRQLKTLICTSSNPGEGKSTTITNFGFSRESS